jgi:hypothetical protein
MKKALSISTFRFILSFVALLFLGSMQGCMFYYKVQTVQNITPGDIRGYDSLNKYLIYHQGDSAWHLSGAGISGDNLCGSLSVLPENRWKFKTTKVDGGNRYIKNKEPNESYVLEEVHLYLQDTVFLKNQVGDSLKIAITDIGRAEIYKKAKGRTNASWLIPGLGLPLLAAGIVTIIIAADINENGLIRGGIRMTGK